MILGPRPCLTLELAAVLVALLAASPAIAQTPAPTADASLERAQKAADSVFHWIKLNGDKGANRQPAAAPAPAPAARKPAPIAAAPKPPTVAAQRSAPAATDAPPPAVATLASESQSPIQADTAPVLVAAAAPTPTPDAPMALAAPALQPAPPPAEEEAEVPLKLLSRVNPVIPRQMQKLSFRDGFARVKFTVAPDGSVSAAESIKASHSRLATAAIDAVKQWRFEPIAAPREAAIEFAFSNGDE
ncbi:MAG: TonB family protein [Rubrivivax sp.]|nr:MAG: TonB family protein [Rubrivivax sp.]